MRRGFIAEALAARGAKVTGIDPAAQAINGARVHAAEAGLEIQYDVGVTELRDEVDGFCFNRRRNAP